MNSMQIRRRLIAICGRYLYVVDLYPWRKTTVLWRRVFILMKNTALISFRTS